VTPYRPASFSTASVNDRWSILRRNPMTSPPSPHPKQYQAPLAGLIENDGLRSSWNGQSPLRLPPPADFSVT